MKNLVRSLVLGSSLLAILFSVSCTTPPSIQADVEGDERAPVTDVPQTADDGYIPPGERYASPYSSDDYRYGHRYPYGWR